MSRSTGEVPTLKYSFETIQLHYVLLDKLVFKVSLLGSSGTGSWSKTDRSLLKQTVAYYTLFNLSQKYNTE